MSLLTTAWSSVSRLIHCTACPTRTVICKPVSSGTLNPSLLFDHAFQGDFSRSGMRWRSAPCGAPCHLIALHLHFNVKRTFTIRALWNVKRQFVTLHLPAFKFILLALVGSDAS